jgi:ferredoxin
MIKDEFYLHQYEVDLIRIEDVLKNNMKVDFNKYDLIGIGSQVIGYAAPNIVKDFIHSLPKEEAGRKVFIFRTAGGVAPVNYNASKSIIRKLGKKGYQVFYERIFSISSNWIIKFDDDIIMQLYEATRKKVSIMCEELIRGDIRILKTNMKLKVLMEFLMLICPLLMPLVGKDYIVNKDCTHCGLCIKNCPVENIYEKKNKIKFKMSCNACMRCVYSCPKNAIRYRFLTFFPVAGGYNIKKILEHPCPASENTKRMVPPFFKDYVEQEI